jgi:anti-sigma factor RsiW
MTTPDRPDDLLLSAWLDRELEPAECARVEAWLRDHPEDAARVRSWAADSEALRARLDPILDEPVPPQMRRRVLGRLPGWRWPQAAAAAGLLLAGALIGAGLTRGLQARGAVQTAAAPAAWVQRAAIAHSVYVPEQRHPVEVSVAEGSLAQQRAQEEHLSRWLARRLDVPVKLFDLRAQGFELVGGRLLPDAPGASAQLMYQHLGGGPRVTVYLRKPEAGTPAAFRYERQGALGLFYWVEGGAGYALVGELPREQLLALAEAIYRQGAAPPAAGSQ